MPDRSRICTHVAHLREVTPGGPGCEECLKAGDTWDKLRLCMICGHVGCGNNSKNKHATKHFLGTGHPIIKDFPDREWTWCYVDEIYIPEGVTEHVGQDDR